MWIYIAHCQKISNANHAHRPTVHTTQEVLLTPYKPEHFNEIKLSDLYTEMFSIAAQAYKEH